MATFTAFSERTQIASGDLDTIIPRLKERYDIAPQETALIFDDLSGKQIDFDLRGTPEEALERAKLQIEPPAKAGRPKLGVVPREVTLLPRHWDWLEAQPSGASAALRRLIDEARKREGDQFEARQAADVCCRVLGSLAGDLPGYEEATRALYARDRVGFVQQTSDWPTDIRAYALRLASPAL